MKKKIDPSTNFEIIFYEKIVQEKPNYIEALISLAEVYTQCGEYLKGLGIDRRLALLCPEDAVVFYNLACSYSLVKKERSAFAALKKSITLGYRDYNHMRRDPDLKFIRSKKQFEELVGRKPRRTRT